LCLKSPLVNYFSLWSSSQNSKWTWMCYRLQWFQVKMTTHCGRLQWVLGQNIITWFNLKFCLSSSHCHIAYTVNLQEASNHTMLVNQNSIYLKFTLTCNTCESTSNYTFMESYRQSLILISIVLSRNVVDCWRSRHWVEVNFCLTQNYVNEH